MIGETQKVQYSINRAWTHVHSLLQMSVLDHLFLAGVLSSSQEPTAGQQDSSSSRTAAAADHAPKILIDGNLTSQSDSTHQTMRVRELEPNG